ncbi:PREDICTED: GATA-type zinc finger protein 1 isoform X1 [Hipposideros armiger]|uniref:GATA-type zinc finger protein 1 isoform X1 n=1 Tax=Hipposideros armiger TaxID=186990 RepID=A0A8B7SN71_HIPAR|nr:PREDICTED: GATA-type zinc finger protein 1 isoform X1 [Hipposideros armiger]
MMEAELVPELSMMLRELAPFCLDPEPLPGTPTQETPRAPRCFRPSGRSFWPAHRDSVTALHFLPETERLAQPPAGDTQALGPCWELKDLGALGPAPLARDARAMLTPVNQQHSLGPQGTHSAPSAPPQKRPRKQLNPHRGAEKVDPWFEGVTLKFQIKPDSNLQIMSSYSLTFSSRFQGPPTGPTGGPEANPGGSEILGPRRCASCRTQRTPLWRDAEDGTPLCNACGIRFAEWRKSWGIRNMAPGAPAAGWCPGKMSSPSGYVADVGYPWVPTKAQLRKGKPFLTQPSLSCLSFSRGRMGGSPPRRNGKQTWVLRAPACMLSVLYPLPIQGPQVEDPGLRPRSLSQGVTCPLLGPCSNQAWLSSLSENALSDIHPVNRDNKEQNYSEKEHCDLGILPLVPSPTCPPAQECGAGVFSLGF